MAESRQQAAVRGARVACPECAREFDSRGLAAHRRKRHGTAAPRTTTHDARAESRAPEESVACEASTADAPNWRDVNVWSRSERAQTQVRMSPSFRPAENAPERPIASAASREGAGLDRDLVQPACVASTASGLGGASRADGHVPEPAHDDDVSGTSCVDSRPRTPTERVNTSGGASTGAETSVRATFSDAPVSDVALLCRAIDVLTDAVRRLDQHLDRVLDVQSRASGLAAVHGDPPDDDGGEPMPPPLSARASTEEREALERDLDAVLAEITRVKSEDAPRAELARLRRRQADVLARLLIADNHDDVAINLRLVSADSGPALRRRRA